VAGKTIQFLRVGPARVRVRQCDCVSDRRRLRLQRSCEAGRLASRYRRKHLAIESESGALPLVPVKNRTLSNESGALRHIREGLSSRVMQASLDSSTLIDRASQMDERYESNATQKSAGYDRAPDARRDDAINLIATRFRCHTRRVIVIACITDVSLIVSDTGRHARTSARIRHADSGDDFACRRNLPFRAILRQATKRERERERGESPSGRRRASTRRTANTNKRSAGQVDRRRKCL